MDVVTIGETMVVFEAGSQGPLRYTHTFTKRHGGAESNVAIGIQRLGHSARWMSQVGDDELGQYLLQSIRGEGVDTNFVTTSPTAPTGLFIKEFRRPNEGSVHYYRAGSAASQMSSDLIDEELFRNAKVLHITGITPLISKSCDEVITKAIHLAKKLGLFVSFDPNLRFKIMEVYGEDRARDRMRELAGLSDLFLPGLDEAEWMYGTNDESEIAHRAFLDGAKQIVIKNGSTHSYYAERDGKSGFVNSHSVDRVVDPIGAGDGFASGVIVGILEEMTLHDAVNLGAAVGALVVSSPGDIEGLPTRKEVDLFLNQTSKDVLR
ncbi:2-dehydro-3-deoxygluconate kinase [Geomicrobium sp. JCM 19037]|uniref:sugar kinase n=1 Tax=unclassified Geomicrobium TaxID=2628951 RepID=UPI00045F18C9|nr:sugar kinase [Geomicrobium sp. JCM 19037]GAK05334.1 2-dehydro-3-deoxygluconate kinase [Geomicrobium sp. JCM 19037]